LIDKKFSLDSLDTIISDIENSIKSKTTELNTCKNEIKKLEKKPKKQNTQLQQLRNREKKLENEIKTLNTKKAKMLNPQQTIKDEYKQLSDSTTKVEKTYNQGVKQFDSERAYLDENTLEVIKDIYKQLIPGKLAGLWQT
jgi:chromosome segregation ATPase